MHKKRLRRLIPSPSTLRANPQLRVLLPLMEHPNLFHLNRYSVSMAFLMGVFLAFFPIPGQMLLAGFFAFVVRCNLPLTVALVWITNPITMPPIFFATYHLGSWLLDTPPIQFSEPISWQWVQSELASTWKPLLIGSLCAGSFFSLSSYFFVKYCWRLYIIYQWKSRKYKRRKAQAKA